MLQNSPSRKGKVVRQGWILKKSRAGIFSQWKTKYLMLVETSRGGILRVYDNRENLKPKHEIPLNGIRIECKNSKFKFLHKGAVPFTIYFNNRKVSIINAVLLCSLY
jgi:hypothetical protein